MPHIEDGTKSRSAMFDVYEGRVCSLRSVLLYSGVCKVNAAAAAQLLIDRYAVTHIINAGVAGGISPDISVFDTVVAEKSVYHDVADDILTEFFPFMPSRFISTPTKACCMPRAVQPKGCLSRCASALLPAESSLSAAAAAMRYRKILTRSP